MLYFFLIFLLALEFLRLNLLIEAIDELLTDNQEDDMI